MADTSGTSKRSADTVERFSTTAHQAVDRAASAASSVAERFGEKGEEFLHMHEDWLETAREYVREKPLQALGIAVAAGYLLSIITRR
jgi:ElaB/YqjD/DUF883 family membrane-anchored ribosome-binding protein